MKRFPRELMLKKSFERMRKFMPPFTAYIKSMAYISKNNCLKIKRCMSGVYPLLCLHLMISCSGDQEVNSFSFDEYEINEISTLFSAENSTEFHSPTSIRAIEGGFLLLDNNRFIKMDHNGNKLFTFGGEGRGPGEYQQVSGFWEIGNTFLIYDRLSAKFIHFDKKGIWMNDTSIDHEIIPLFPSSIVVIDRSLFAIATRGDNGSLAMIVNLESEQIKYIGEALGDYIRMDPPPDPYETHKAVNSRVIPEDYKNSVLLDSNETGLFIYQQTTAMLEKYSHDGELLWSRNLKFPIQEGLFDHMFEVNADRLNRGSPVSYNYGFNHAMALSATPDGIAVLINKIEKDSVTVAWVSNDGEDISLINFKGINHYTNRFAIPTNIEKPFILFVNSLQGIIYKADWPL
ncbi:MAG: hypothetical protein WD317_11500 [Balneolaceae bacterium]